MEKDRLFWLTVILYLEIVLLLDHIGNDFAI